MSKHVPQFASDPAYKKRTVAQLTTFLDRMNHEWKEAEKERERVTRAKATRNQSDGFEYTDVDTGERIPLQAYQETYRQRMMCDSVDPILRLLPVPTPSAVPIADAGACRSSFGSRESESDGEMMKRSDPRPALSSSTDSDRARANRLSSLLGVDLSKSCIIDDEFYKRAALTTDGELAPRAGGVPAC